MAATAVPLRSRRAARRRQLLRVGDERLVARVRAGDDDAFEAIYDRYYLSLLAFCRHMLGSRHEAEDALQHSFASAYSALRGGDGVEDLRPWLYTIARNRCLSALRAQREELCADELELRPRAFDGLAGEIQLRSDLRDLVDDLQRLPEDQRAALVLFELGDQSHEQIAEVLGVRREKVKALVFQAREALLRARAARDEPCAEVRERVATGDVPRRSVLRGHIDRCPSCAAFEREVRRQRAAFAAIMPVAPTVGLKASILAALGCGSAAAVGGTGATVVGTGATVVGTGATVAGSVAAGGTTIGLASLGAKGVVTKALAVVALAGGTTGTHATTQRAPGYKAPATHHVARTTAAGDEAARARASHSRRAPAPMLLHGSKAKHHATAPHAAPAPAKAPPVAPAAPEAAHAAPTQASATTPQPVQQTTASAPATQAPAATSQQQQPAAAPAAQTAPSTPTAQPDTSSSASSTSAPAAAPTSTPQPSAAPDTSAPASPTPDAATAQTSAAAPTVAADATT